MRWLLCVLALFVGITAGSCRRKPKREKTAYELVTEAQNRGIDGREIDNALKKGKPALQKLIDDYD